MQHVKQFHYFNSNYHDVNVGGYSYPVFKANNLIETFQPLFSPSHSEKFQLGNFNILKNYTPAAASFSNPRCNSVSYKIFHDNGGNRVSKIWARARYVLLHQKRRITGRVCYSFTNKRTTIHHKGCTCYVEQSVVEYSSPESQREYQSNTQLFPPPFSFPATESSTRKPASNKAKRKDITIVDNSVANDERTATESSSSL